MSERTPFFRPYRCTACGFYHADADPSGRGAPVIRRTCPECHHAEAERVVVGSDLGAMTSDLQGLEVQLHELANKLNTVSLRAHRDRLKKKEEQ